MDGESTQSTGLALCDCGLAQMAYQMAYLGQFFAHFAVAFAVEQQ
ncbi:hypothetical protein VO64_3616 [Pseudomonas synxantha]|uniref:Uncharacterized protein n=1 Tax=Pseudomonas synxantha TaxID=47883 RepID=A0AAU8U0G1_9PSED|nr:hypothetical protein VO64_3616 [Pseudomonas synxantha]